MLSEPQRDTAHCPRLTPEDGLSLLQRADLLELADRASAVRFRLHPRPQVSFLLDTNPNYTNICRTRCLFCAFYREPTAEDAYTLSVEAIVERVEWAVQQGATTVLLQGGHNPDLPLDYYLDLVRAIRSRFPGVTAHCFSAPEIHHIATISGISTRQVLERLRDAGQSSLPGGGAEILAERVRRRISPRKPTVQQWLEIHRQAHALGMRSTATMMYGHVENDLDVIEHLEAIRRLQDETGGFTAFIPWSFKPANTRLQRWVPEPAGANRYLRLIALARIYLDNFPHIQASWFPEGKKVGQIALHFGADDFGGTLMEEHVHEAAGHRNTTTLSEVVSLIQEAGFQPVQRTTLYDALRCFQAPGRRP